MSKNTAAKPAGVSQTIAQLLEISRLDTLYRDLYFQRASELMEDQLSRPVYNQIKESAASLGLLERQLRSAVERGDWQRSRELTERIRTLRGSAAAMVEKMRLGEALYDGAADIPIDPFSPGLNVFVSASSQKLHEWREQALRILSTLERQDSSKKDFYARRGADFKALAIQASTEQKEEKKAGAAPAELRQEALNALESGDLSRLDELVQKLMEKPAEQDSKKEASVELREAEELGDDLDYSFTDATLEAAGRLGLARVRTESRRQFAYLIPHGWQPAFLKDELKQWSKDQLARLAYPSGTTDEVKDAIEFYLLNPFINSGGTRFKVCMVAEDLLIEDFPEPEPKQQMPDSNLLRAMGLESRWGLSRIDIENAVLQHGPRILKEELTLDPEAFRLVAIPPDIFTHFARERGWGQREMWTHFDGYRVREGGKLHALAGGDKRFGGTHDLVSFNSAFARETMLTRFAVVQRKRMMTWHGKVA
jgi:hypothetical protein